MKLNERQLYVKVRNLVMFLMSTAVACGVVINHSGTQTYPSNVGANSTINIPSGSATFEGTINSGTVVNQSGGGSIFNGNIKNNVVFNLSGGLMEVNSIQNNAQINQSGGTLLLNQPIGNGASVNVSGGSLDLGADGIFANNTNITLSGGLLATNGFGFNVDSLTLSGNSTIDLGGNEDIQIDLGAVSGSGTVTFTNWGSGNVINYDSLNLGEGGDIIFDGVGSVIGGGTIIPPVPEPKAYVMGAALLLLIGFHRYRRLRSSVE